MLEALNGGTTDPEVLAELARGRLRSKIPALREALEGRFSSHHALMVGRILSHIDYLDESIGELSTEIERVIAPFSEEVELLESIPGGEPQDGRSSDRGDRGGHEPLSHPFSPGLMGRHVSGQRGVGG